MALATLSIDLNAKLAGLQQGLDKAGRLAERQAAQIERAFSGLKNVGVGVGAALAASLSVAGITQFVRSTVDGIDKLNDLSDATGASIENLSALEDIAVRTGTSIDTVGDAVIKLNKTLGDASKPGSEAANAIKALGLSAQELKRLDPAEAFRQVAVALAGFADDGNKARVVQELFGKSIREVAPLLKDVAEAGKLNATVTTAQAKAAEQFNQQLAAFQKNVTDSARAMTGDLLPALNQFFERVRGLDKAGGFFGFLKLELGANLASDRLRVVTSEIERLQKTADRQGLTGMLEKRMSALKEEASGLTKKALEASQALKDFANTGAPLKPTGRPANEGGGGLRSRNQSLPDIVADAKAAKAPKEIQPIAVKLDDTTIAALKRLEETDANKIGQLRLELQALIELRPEGGSEGSDEAIRKLVDELTKLDPEARKAAESKRRLDEILSQTPSGVLADVLSDIELINAAFDSGSKEPEKWAEAIRVAVGKLPQDVEKPLAEISEFAQQAARNIQDSLGDSILATFEGNSKSISKIWGDMLKRLVAQAAAAQIAKSLFGDNFGSTGQMGGAVGSLFGWLSSQGGGARAGGGPVMSGRPYLVGERGPEIVVPRQNGTVIPNGAGMGGTGTVNFTTVIQGDASANTLRLIRASQNQMAARMASASRY